MGKTNEVELNKEMFTDSNGKTYPLSDLEKYDFSNDGASDKYCEITDIYKKTFLDVAVHCPDSVWKFGAEYSKKMAEKFCKSDIPDPDSKSSLLQEIYRTLWNEVFKKMQDEKHIDIMLDNKNICGDTMNSIWFTLDRVYEKEIETEEQCEQRVKRGNISKRYLLNRYVESRYSSVEEIRNLNIHEDLKEDANKCEFVSNLDKIRGLRAFLESAHTLGNFIPVPEGCNQPRGSYFGELRDYWDLTLLIIYNYYTGKKDDIRKIVEKVSVNEGENKEEKIEELTKRYKEWLDSFGNWDNFVRKNYMRAFVNIKEYGKEKYDENEHYDMPRELWDGHFKAFSERGVALPENTEQAEQFFERTSFCIHERSVDMIDELKKRL